MHRSYTMEEGAKGRCTLVESLGERWVCLWFKDNGEPTVFSVRLHSLADVEDLIGQLTKVANKWHSEDDVTIGQLEEYDNPTKPYEEWEGAP